MSKQRDYRLFSEELKLYFELNDKLNHLVNNEDNFKGSRYEFEEYVRSIENEVTTLLITIYFTVKDMIEILQKEND